MKKKKGYIKKDVGERLVFWVHAKDFNKDFVYSGPLYTSFKINENKIEIEFDNIGTGLAIK